MRAIRDGRDEAATGAAQRRSRVRWAIASLSLSTLLSSLGAGIANVALPTLAASFRAPFHAVQWVVLAYLVATTTLVVSAGRLGDLTGRRRLLGAGILVFTGASALCGLAPALWVLVAARALQGAGAATMLALTMAFVGETVPKERIGAAMGLLGTMSAVGTALGPSLGGLLVAGPGWRAVFLVNLPLGAAALAMTARFLPADRRGGGAEKAAFDSAGTGLLALTLASYALAMTPGRGGLGPRGAALLAGAALGVALFVLVEVRAKAPLVRPETLRDPALGAGLAASALVSTVIMATMVVGPFYLSGALGLDAGRVGAVLSAGPLAAAMTGVPAGRAVDRFGARRMTLAGLLGIAAGAIGLSALPATTGVVGYVVPILVLTAHYALFQTANNTSVLADVDAGRRGVVSGLLSLSRNLGLITGASVMGFVFARASGAADVAAARPVELAAGMRTVFAVAAVLVLIALGVALARRGRAARGAARGSRPGLLPSKRGPEGAGPRPPGTASRPPAGGVLLSAARRERDEARGPSHVLRVLGAPRRHVGVEERDAGDLHEEERHERRGEDRRPAPRRVERQEPEAPPEERVAEVVRVAAEAPEAGVEDGAGGTRAATGAGSPVACELRVRDGLDPEAGEEHAEAEQVGERERVGRGDGGRDLERRRDDDDERSLEEEDLEEAEPPVALRSVLRAEGGVARVLGHAEAPEEEVEEEPESPRRDRREEERLAGRHPGPQDGVRRDEEERDRPPRVDDARVAPANADDPEDRHERQDERGVAGEQPEAHRGPRNASCAARPARAASAVRKTPQARSIGTRSAGQPRMTAQFVSSYVA